MAENDNSQYLRNIQFLGHATFQISGSSIIYTDPYDLSGYQFLEEADIILVTHSHFDHCSVDDIAKIRGDRTIIVTSSDCSEFFKNSEQSDEVLKNSESLEAAPGKVITLSPGEETEVGNVKVRAVPAYNIGKNFHPKKNNWNGYLFDLDGVRYYHPGDSDKVPEMDSITADVIFLPVGGTYTMDAREACEVANRINTKVAIPMHYGSVIGSEKDAEDFVMCVGGKGVVLPRKKVQ